MLGLSEEPAGSIFRVTIWCRWVTKENEYEKCVGHVGVQEGNPTGPGLLPYSSSYKMNDAWLLHRYVTFCVYVCVRARAGVCPLKRHHYHHYHLPPWIRSFDLFRHRRIDIVSWGVHWNVFTKFAVLINFLLNSNGNMADAGTCVW